MRLSPMRCTATLRIVMSESRVLKTPGTRMVVLRTIDSGFGFLYDWETHIRLHMDFLASAGRLAERLIAGRFSARGAQE